MILFITSAVKTSNPTFIQCPSILVLTNEKETGINDARLKF
jgi:hypothetical protein